MDLVFSQIFLRVWQNRRQTKRKSDTVDILGHLSKLSMLIWCYFHEKMSQLIPRPDNPALDSHGQLKYWQCWPLLTNGKEICRWKGGTGDKWQPICTNELIFTKNIAGLIHNKPYKSGNIWEKRLLKSEVTLFHDIIIKRSMMMTMAL